MSLKRKFLAAMALPVAVLASATALSYVAESRANESAMLVDHTFQVRAALDQVLSHVVDAETGTRGYLLTGRAEYLSPYVEGAFHVRADLGDLARLVENDASQAARVEQLEPLIQQRLELLGEMQRLAPIRQETRGDLQVLLGSSKEAMEDVRAVIQAMKDEEVRLLTERRAGLEAANRTASLAQLTILPAGLIVSLILIAVLSDRVVRRIRRIEENARRLEGGEPMLEDDRSSDELGRLARRMVWTGTQLTQLQEELRHMATVDALTGLVNRRGFLTLAQSHLELAVREHRPLALLFVDLDGLKDVNDRLGHSAGDELIREAAVALQETFRASDVAARMGGDEFCVLLTAPSALEVDTAVRRLRDTEARANARHGRRFPLSMSIGVAELPRYHEGTTVDDLMGLADERMYEDKRRRREPARSTAEAGVPI